MFKFFIRQHNIRKMMKCIRTHSSNEKGYEEARPERKQGLQRNKFPVKKQAAYSKNTSPRGMETRAETAQVTEGSIN